MPPREYTPAERAAWRKLKQAECELYYAQRHAEEAREHFQAVVVEGRDARERRRHLSVVASREQHQQRA
jgi:hypothetical protein